ncbi:MAG: hypothetical protein ACQESM_06990 [Bacteroidota bacterium]
MEKQKITDSALNHLKEPTGMAYRYEFLHQKTEKTQKLFTALGLKIVFNLLITPKLINQTYSSGSESFLLWMIF